MYANERGILNKSEFFVYHASDFASKIYFCVHSIGDYYYKKGYHLQRQRYSAYLIMYICSGRCRIRTENEIRDIESGYFIFLDTHQPHEYTFPEDTHAQWMYFDGPLASTYYGLIRNAQTDLLKSSPDSKVLRMIQDLLQTFRKYQVIHDAEVSERIASSLQTFLFNPVETSNRLQHQVSVENACSYINENYSDPLTLEDLASKAGMSPYHFTRIFTEQAGCTPHKYVIGVRLHAAKYLLQRSDCPPVKEVAFDCGFNSESSFCSVFRKWTGQTPSEFRSSVCGVEEMSE